MHKLNDYTIILIKYEKIIHKFINFIFFLSKSKKFDIILIMKYMIEIQFLGKNFKGFQHQEGLSTVQNTVESALSKVLKENIQIFACSRTDAGVNAFALPAHFETNGGIPPERLPFAVNQMLPNDVKIIKCIKKADDFNVRKSVKKKIYQYNLYISSHSLPIIDGTSYQIKQKLCFAKMKKACRFLKGTHDFKAYSSTGSNFKTTVKKIYYIKIKKHKNQIEILVCGNSFLYNMVRIIVGTLILIGQNKLDLSVIKKSFLSKERKLVGFVAPSKALFFKKAIF